MVDGALMDEVERLRRQLAEAHAALDALEPAPPRREVRPGGGVPENLSVAGRVRRLGKALAAGAARARKLALVPDAIVRSIGQMADEGARPMVVVFEIPNSGGEKYAVALGLGGVEEDVEDVAETGAIVAASVARGFAKAALADFAPNQEQVDLTMAMLAGATRVVRENGVTILRATMHRMYKSEENQKQ